MPRAVLETSLRKLAIPSDKSGEICDRFESVDKSSNGLAASRVKRASGSIKSEQQPVVRLSMRTERELEAAVQIQAICRGRAARRGRAHTSLVMMPMDTDLDCSMSVLSGPGRRRPPRNMAANV